MKKRTDLDKLIDAIEETIECGSMLNQFQMGLGLKVIEDRMWDINTEVAQRCNDLQHKILENK